VKAETEVEPVIVPRRVPRANKSVAAKDGNKSSGTVAGVRTKVRRTAETAPGPEPETQPETQLEPKSSNDGMHTMDGRKAEPLPRPVSRNLDPSQIYRGKTRMALIRDLAMGEWNDETIARSIGVPTIEITTFRETYETDINEVRQALAGQLAIESAGLWISKKYNRVGELQSDFEDIDLVIDVMRRNTREQIHTLQSGSDSMVQGDEFDTNLLLGSRRHQNLLRAKISILKAVADEYAPNKQQKDTETEDNSIRYVITQDQSIPGTPTGTDDVLSALT
jgi:hypothetical protein